jgi:hypothetical protein
LDQASSEIERLKSELEQANAERKDLQNKLNQSRSEVQPSPGGNAPSEPGQ